MTPADLPEVLAIERSAFPTPWSEAAFQAELTGNSFARLLVARLERGGPVVGYVCFWVIFDELRILNVASAVPRRRLGVATALLQAALAAGREARVREATLEVRPSNSAARALYAKLGFAPAGRRRGYYADGGEDALVLALPLADAGG
jgi:ribosomal-protein-alanine N-acetyltransferase